MKILITGQPGVGKSTVIEGLIDAFRQSSVWMLTREILDDEGQRAGFVTTTSTGKHRLISHKRDIVSDVLVGSNRVDISALKDALGDILNEAINTKPSIVILDEIGPIQLTDTEFIQKMDSLYNSDVTLIATMHVDDHRLKKYRESPIAIRIFVSENNRDILPKLLQLIISRRAQYDTLEVNEKYVANYLIESYLEMKKVMQLKKLLRNAIPYVLQNKVTQLDPSHWSVAGNHGSYEVTISEDYICTCDLFLGKNAYSNNPGECSHIQAVKILNGIG